MSVQEHRRNHQTRQKTSILAHEWLVQARETESHSSYELRNTRIKQQDGHKRRLESCSTSPAVKQPASDIYTMSHVTSEISPRGLPKTLNAAEERPTLLSGELV